MSKGLLIFAVIILAFTAGIAYLGYKGTGTNILKTSREIALGCTTDEETVFHIHPDLQIIINGQIQTIPADVGISPGCMHPIHTHDIGGTIHVESPVKKDFTLGDFFAVWGKVFTKDQILDSVKDQRHEIKVTINGTPSYLFENTILKDKDKIIVEYKKI